MELFSNSRLFFFNWLDKISGGHKSRQYNEVKSLIENGNSQENITKKKAYLNNLLEHAANTTSYYSSYKTVKNIAEFPVVNKNSIRVNFSEFESATYKSKKNTTVKTSGSTGTPFKTYQNKNKVLRNAADNLYFTKKAGYTIGNKLYYFRMWRAFEQKNFFERYTQNIVPIDVFDLTDAFFEKFITDISNTETPMSWIGYTSAFDQICKYLDKTKSKPISCNLQSAIAISEGLSEQTKTALKKYFNVNMVSRYSNVENGIMAQQFPNTSYFIINTASYHIEILKPDNTPAKPGEKGRIVVTDLFNYCVPMIRYDTGDIGSMDIVDNKPILLDIEGRKADIIFNTKGDIVSRGLVHLVNNYHELKQCQIIQKSKLNYLFKINIEGKFTNEEKFKTDFKSYLGNDAIIDIEYVNEIPLLASGKRRVLVNDMDLNTQITR